MSDPIARWRYRTRHMAEPMQRTMQALVRPNSLSQQVAMTAITMILGAIIAVVILSLLAVSFSFSSLLHTRLQADATEAATMIGSNYTYVSDGDPSQEMDRALRSVAQGGYGKIPFGDAGLGAQFWIMGATGEGPTLLRGAVARSPDFQIVVAAMNHAMQTGRPQYGDLSGQDALWIHIPTRAYAVAPIFDSTHTHIVGVVAFSSLRNIGDTGTVFVQDVDHWMLWGALAIAVVVGLMGALLARRITQPIDRLQRAATKMAHGDLSTRVEVDVKDEPDELEQLALAFNEMAATIERDVNESRRQERMQRELVANVAHELATPLTAIQGFSEALIDNMVRSDREREEICRIINRETVRLRRLVDQLRQVARLEAGTEPMDLQPTKLAALVSNTVEVLRGDRERSGVIIRNHVQEDLPLVLADGDRLTQVLLNLLDNAERHTPPDGHIDVTAYLVDNWVWVTVADTGCGIPQEDVPRIFDRFFRADASRARATGGSGLGLAIVKGIVEAHGGRVYAESELGAGTRISFCLRVAPQPVMPEQKAPALVR